MAEPFIGEIRISAAGIVPTGWAACNGQILSINQNQALFSILGTTYGGDGKNNFALPDLRGRSPMHFGPGYTLGQAGGESAHVLTSAEMPAHVHQVYGQAATTSGTSGTPAGGSWLENTGQNLFAASPNAPMSPAALGTTGGNQAHNNQQPCLTLNYIIALQGIYPSRN